MGRSPFPLPQTYHYILFSLSPPTTDPIRIRKSIQDALSQSFGLTSASTYLDILWIADDGNQSVVRTGPA